MANMRIVMLTHAENEYYSALYPPNANNEIISEINCEYCSILFFYA